jgi:hypothetical protein
MFSVLAHEMVHLKQMAKGEMKDKYVKSRYVTVWRGDRYEDDVNYWDQPWELEAYKLQERGNLKMKRWLLDHVHYQPTLKTRDL